MKSFTFDVPDDIAALMRAKVESGAYNSIDEIVIEATTRWIDARKALGTPADPLRANDT